MDDKLHLQRKEVFLYIITGIATTFIHVFVYQLLLCYGVGYVISNIMAHISSKLGAYILSKRYVFHTQEIPLKKSLKEFIRFFFARGITALLDFFGLIILVEMFSCSPILSKYFLVILGISLNYFFSKYYVFKS